MMIINADDFGLDIKTNDAIVESFQKGFISSTTLMANMGGFDDACEKAKLYGLQSGIGIHLNLTSGRPISEPIKSNRRFCDETGHFFRDRKSLYHLTKQDQSDIFAEYSAQIKRMLSSGINPTHIDSHHHFHTQLPLLSIVCRLAKSYQIPSVRLTRNCGEGISTVRRLYKYMANNYIRTRGLSTLDYFGSVEDVIQLNQVQHYKFEIMVHPTYSIDGTLIDASNKSKMSDNYEKIRAKFSDMKLMNYGEIKGIKR
jgi:hypothetical protein